MRLGIAVLLLACVSTAGAEQIIWKCKGPKGVPIFQNVPCAPGQALQGAKVYDTPDRPEAIIERSRHEAEMDRRNASMHSGGGSSYATSQVQTQRCQAAREAAANAARQGVPFPARGYYERAAVDACFGL